MVYSKLQGLDFGGNDYLGFCSPPGQFGEKSVFIYIFFFYFFFFGGGGGGSVKIPGRYTAKRKIDG